VFVLNICSPTILKLEARGFLEALKLKVVKGSNYTMTNS
jgi:hypothetical protein